MSEATYEQVLEYCRKRCLVLMDREFFEHLKRWPVDMVQVVRCKDCGWWNEDDSAGWGDLGNNVCACAYFSNEDGYTVYTEPNDYCSKVQRKEDEG